MAVSTIKNPTDIAPQYMGQFGSNEAGSYTFTLPQGFFLVAVRKTNAAGDGTQGLYLVNSTSSNGGRITVTPVLALALGMSLTGAYTDVAGVLTLNTASQTYVRGYIFKLV